MITKFKSINNLAVFQNFDWDSTIRDSSGNNVVLFKPINIFYGRNYSGKTTLSRIVRALETGNLSEKYENPQFEVCITDVADCTPNNLTEHRKKIRVFNEDFVKANLRFIVNPDESVSPFAIIGGNATIEAEIQALKSELGEKENIEEDINATGFYLELKNTSLRANTALVAYQNANKNLTDQLRFKATNNPLGIKYKSDKYGDQNYNINKLQNEVNTVLENSFQPLTDDEVTEKLNLLNESANSNIPEVEKPKLDLDTLNIKAKELVTKSISNSNKIEQLLKDAILNRWVKEGRQLHKDKLDKCSFCGNDITKERWNELESHFDEESEKLEKEIDTLISETNNTIQNIEKQLIINKTLFYSKFHSDLDTLTIQKEEAVEKIKSELNIIIEKLQERKNDILNSKTYNDITDNSKLLENCWSSFETFRIQANEYTSSLETEQTKAKRLLRLREVSDFTTTIQYTTVKARVQTLKDTSDTETQSKKVVEEKINQQINQIEAKERLMNDEEKGAIKVNEYLNNFFGHDFLTLQALEDTDEFGGKKIKFEIVRNGNKAHHLSEGESSLIAFCYFMAKLEDVDTKGSKPIIWIDDPISSLDSNHIFFVYSLISAEIFTRQEFEQIFISTHNLDFLKYLKRLPSALNKNQCSYFLISRENEISKITLMPRYLKDYVTEFNFLFHQIYKCSIAESDDENQHNLYYNFGNNTRKFLEAFLFYKYPNTSKQIDKLTKFFGNNRQASTMTDRINNEFSHLEGLFERSMTPIDIPEMKKTAKFILDKIKEKDNEQYEALLLSIGIEVQEEV
ncbi:wobble nucleotide-excising tRNase [Tenacibaculum gallaicum]|uniref:Wobble nucleotide-excising tRNase n=1 Tax=Tenacibaculum gallaicum TaxID=561505 RepID=A0A3E0I871_9FLAO|nr:AAA family ATPase [Tenacibaculum gallaicum]REH54968.1 wobble nucleotide-excising tRNase [Tenacibaculum gallaicum]